MPLSGSAFEMDTLCRIVVTYYVSKYSHSYFFCDSVRFMFPIFLSSTSNATFSFFIYTVVNVYVPLVFMLYLADNKDEGLGIGGNRAA